MDVAPVLRARSHGTPHDTPHGTVNGTPLVAGADLATELKTAVVNGDETRIGALLTELLHVKRPTEQQRVAVQLQALQNLIEGLRLLTISDETTGLSNRRGFVQSATRLLDLAARDKQPADLVYFHLGRIEQGSDTPAPVTSPGLLREMGNLLRDLFPDYGVREVLGRLNGSEFAALTLSSAYASRQAILGQKAAGESACGLPEFQLSVGIAHFDPQRPIAIGELLQRARQALHQRVVRFASSGPMPPNRSDALPTVSRRPRQRVDCS